MTQAEKATGNKVINCLHRRLLKHLAFNKLKNSENLVQNAYKDAQALYIAKATDPEWIAQAGNPSKWTESALGKACIKKFVPDAEKAMV